MNVGIEFQTIEMKSFNKYNIMQTLKSCLFIHLKVFNNLSNIMLYIYLQLFIIKIINNQINHSKVTGFFILKP